LELIVEKRICIITCKLVFCHLFFQCPNIINESNHIEEWLNIKDGLVDHHWKERPIGRANFIASVQGNTRAKKWEWVSGGVGGGACGGLLG
jgi:hypothetical protein